MSHPAIDVLEKLPELPGIYKIYGDKNIILYIGKAKNLKNRVNSYFRSSLDIKTTKLMQCAIKVDFLITNSEYEALLLEHNLIKTFKPRFNILLKDDKSFFFIKITQKKDFPQIYIIKSKSNKSDDRIFGPYTNKHSVKKVTEYIQKTFKIRECTDASFKNRTRPCLLYQIKKCSAPCVNYITKSEYSISVQIACDILSGKSNNIITKLTNEMNKDSDNLLFEDALIKRDLIHNINLITSSQLIYGLGGDYDLIEIMISSSKILFEVYTIRDGKIISNDKIWHKDEYIYNKNDFFSNIILQYYLKSYNLSKLPNEIVCESIENPALVERFINSISTKKVKVTTTISGKKIKLAKMIKRNMLYAINNEKLALEKYEYGFNEINKLFKKIEVINTIDCIDISHISGHHAVGAVISFTRNGPEKSMYRKYNLGDNLHGDDLQAIFDTVYKRYKKKNTLPNMIIIDGGPNQLNYANLALTKLSLNNVIPIISISKGKERKVGNEVLHQLNPRVAFKLSENKFLFQLIVEIRDEAHNYAIRSHRKLRTKETIFSQLDSIKGVGPKKKKLLIDYLGGINNIKEASNEDLQKIPGIDVKLAKKIYMFFR